MIELSLGLILNEHLSWKNYTDLSDPFCCENINNTKECSTFLINGLHFQKLWLLTYVARICPLNNPPTSYIHQVRYSLKVSRTNCLHICTNSFAELEYLPDTQKECLLQDRFHTRLFLSNSYIMVCDSHEVLLTSINTYNYQLQNKV